VRVLSCAVTLALARQQHDARVIICRGSVPVNESSSAASYPGARTRLGSYSPHLLQHRGRPAQTAASPPDRSPLAQAGRGKHRPDRTASTIVQTCLIHLIRNSFRFASRKYWDELSRDLKPIYTAVHAEAAAAALDDLDAKWGTRYPAIIRLWRNAWEEFIPFLDHDVEIRKVLCSTNAIESLNARYRRAVKARGLFPPSRPP
jgi:hypothetical protein